MRGRFHHSMNGSVRTVYLTNGTKTTNATNVKSAYEFNGNVDDLLADMGVDMVEAMVEAEELELA